MKRDCYMCGDKIEKYFYKKIRYMGKLVQLCKRCYLGECPVCGIELIDVKGVHSHGEN